MQVARLNFHFWTARYLNQQVAARKQGDKLLKKEEKMLSAASPDQSSLQHQAIVVSIGITHAYAHTYTHSLRVPYTVGWFTFGGRTQNSS